ncbi:hypothetical protein [Heyndrickxia sp. FSL W8-0423]|uniref:hypothetical protein n=1 Tax=Heyndrickxia sp. FSL W8-0423 TaxID=2921601 RepID=UPI0030FBA0C9
MKTVEKGIEVRVYPKSWGREVYFDTLEDCLDYIDVDFIQEKVKNEACAWNEDSFIEFGIQEGKTGFILSVFVRLSNEMVHDLYTKEN